MNLNISGHRMELTEALHNHVTDKMARLDRHFDNIIDADVILKVDKPKFIAEATMNIKGATINAQSEAEDMYIAINAMVDKLDRQTRKHRNKKVDQRVRHQNLNSVTADGSF